MSKISLTSSLDFSQPPMKFSNVPVVATEVRSPMYNKAMISKDKMQSMRVPLLDPKVIARARTSNNGDLEPQARSEIELSRQISESPNCFRYRTLMIYQLVNPHFDELKTPIMRMVNMGESLLRPAEYPRVEKQDSAFAVFNPGEEMGMSRFCNAFGAPFGRSPTSQFPRFVAQSEDRDESPFEEAANFTPLSTLFARSYFTSAGLNGERDAENKHNYQL
eukprot:TRINITY_DN853_c0_g1_i36.p1 TRINITY_DN853_c0_g1~~TRINITY_DN853_c0_g1_i36.p1  ORF type:complete len:220 (+),score=26.55 TRINITY_DN853_c0_g1_i36:886-1545(+)